MGENLQELEERLNQLVPRGLSENGQARMEAEIDRLAEEVGAPGTTRYARLGIWSAAACLLISGSIYFSRPPATAPADPVASAVPVNPPVPVVDREVALIEFLASQMKVTEMKDDGWGLENGAERPHRYWISMVTETEDLLDHESGYQVKVVSEREVIVPVLLTHL